MEDGAILIGECRGCNGLKGMTEILPGLTILMQHHEPDCWVMNLVEKDRYEKVLKDDTPR